MEYLKGVKIALLLRALIDHISSLVRQHKRVLFLADWQATSQDESVGNWIQVVHLHDECRDASSRALYYLSGCYTPTPYPNSSVPHAPGFIRIPLILM